MKAQLPRSILVPVLDGDISEAALARGRSMLVACDAQLVLLLIVSRPKSGDVNAVASSGLADAQPARWRQLAATARPGRVFVEAVEGDPARNILVEAERFRSDIILLDRPVADVGNATSIGRVIAQVRRAAPGRVRVARDTARRYTVAMPPSPITRPVT